jgi:hypothetical protein
VPRIRSRRSSYARQSRGRSYRAVEGPTPRNFHTVT